jgi:hypothetical protein
MSVHNEAMHTQYAHGEEGEMNYISSHSVHAMVMCVPGMHTGREEERLCKHNSTDFLVTWKPRTRYAHGGRGSILRKQVRYP